MTKDELKWNYVNNILVYYIKKCFFWKMIWQLLLRVLPKKEGVVLGLQKNLRTRWCKKC